MEYCLTNYLPCLCVQHCTLMVFIFSSAEVYSLMLLHSGMLWFTGLFHPHLLTHDWIHPTLCAHTDCHCDSFPPPQLIWRIFLRGTADNSNAWKMNNDTVVCESPANTCSCLIDSYWCNLFNELPAVWLDSFWRHSGFLLKLCSKNQHKHTLINPSYVQSMYKIHKSQQKSCLFPLLSVSPPVFLPFSLWTSLSAAL